MYSKGCNFTLNALARIWFHYFIDCLIFVAANCHANYITPHLHLISAWCNI